MLAQLRLHGGQQLQVQGRSGGARQVRAGHRCGLLLVVVVVAVVVVVLAVVLVVVVLVSAAVLLLLLLLVLDLTLGRHPGPCAMWQWSDPKVNSGGGCYVGVEHVGKGDTGT